MGMVDSVVETAAEAWDDTVAFLASPRSSYVTGQVLLACGGRSVVG